jgi:hypothetical protein
VSVLQLWAANQSRSGASCAEPVAFKQCALDGQQNGLYKTGVLLEREVLMIKSDCVLRSLRVACVLALFGACSDGPVVGAPIAGTGAPPTGTDMLPVGTAGASGTGTAGATTTGAAGTTSSAAGTSASGAAGRAAAGSGAAVAGATATAGAGAAGMPASVAGTAAAGSGGAAPPPPMGTPLKDCESGSLEACGTLMTAEGTKIQLGPYGSIMERNMGKGFETMIASGDSDGGASCISFTSLFAEDPAATERLLDTGDLKFDLYTVYRPVNMKDGEKYPILTWGNGTCAQPEGYGPLLRYVASQGFFVIAANSRWVGGNSAMTKALDYAFAANEDAMGPYYHRMDTTKVGAFGHSQGSSATVSAASDARVKVVILFNGGTSASKKFLAVSGERDIGSPTVASYQSGTNSGTMGSAFLFYHKIKGTGSASGHLTLMTQPERVTEPTAAWFKYTLNGDAESKAYFVGTDCKLCNMPMEFDYGQKGLM